MVNIYIYIPYPLILWVMFYPTIVPWPSTVFFDNIDYFCITPIEPRVMFFFCFSDFFVKQFLFRKKCRWNTGVFYSVRFPWWSSAGTTAAFRCLKPLLRFFGLWTFPCPAGSNLGLAFRRKKHGALAIHQNETAPPKMGRLNLPPHPFRFVSVFLFAGLITAIKGN